MCIRRQHLLCVVDDEGMYIHASAQHKIPVMWAMLTTCDL